MNKCFTSLRDPETPNILRIATPTCIRLVELTTPPRSAKRFEELCTILGDGIIGSVWLYSSQEPDVLQASLDVLPAVLSTLGIGASRYLKVRDGVISTDTPCISGGGADEFYSHLRRHSFLSSHTHFCPRLTTRRLSHCNWHLRRHSER